MRPVWSCQKAESAGVNTGLTRSSGAAHGSQMISMLRPMYSPRIVAVDTQKSLKRPEGCAKRSLSKKKKKKKDPARFRVSGEVLPRHDNANDQTRANTFNSCGSPFLIYLHKNATSPSKHRVNPRYLSIQLPKTWPRAGLRCRLPR